MIQKLLTTIGICTHNDGDNIASLIKSVLNQKQTSFKTVEIIVISDASTDNTREIMKNIKHKLVRFIDSHDQRGLSYRQNQIGKIAKGQIIIFLDGDIYIKSTNLFDQLIRPFQDRKVALTSGNPYPMPGKTFIAKCVQSPVIAFQKIKKFNHGDNVFASVGMAYAIKKSFALNTSMPENISANDVYLYLKCINSGYKFVYVEKAKVHYFMASTLNDHIAQSIRHNSSKYSMYKYFDKSYVDKMFYLPKWFYAKTLASEFIKSPIYSTSIFFINFYTKYKAIKYGKENHSSWQRITIKKSI